MSECNSGLMSEGDRNHDGKHSDKMTGKMMDGKHSDKMMGKMMDDNKRAAADTKLSSSERCDDGSKHAATDPKLSSSVKMRSRCSFKRRRGMEAATPLKPMVWIIIASLIQLAHCGYITVDVTTDEFNLTETPHAHIFGIIHVIAADAMPWLEVQDHRYLGAKERQPSEFGGDGSGPSRWIKVPFRGETDEDRATIALADNDLSLSAFMNNVGTWHCFRGSEDMFPDCIVLNSGLDERGEEWDETYPNLIEGGFEMLHTVPLGKKSDLEATRMLARYRHGINISSLIELKNALVRKKIMYPEAVKIRVVRETFSGDLWETETHISAQQAQLIPHWGKISYFLWRWDREGGEFLREREEIKIGQQTGITSAHKALQAYDLFRRPQVLRIRVPQD